MRNKFFLDTSFSIAIAVEKDVFHERAIELADKIEAETRKSSRLKQLFWKSEMRFQN